MLQALRSRTAAWRPLAALAAGVLALHAALLSAWSGPVPPPLGRAPPGLVSMVVQLLPRTSARLAPTPAEGAGAGLSGQPAAPEPAVPARRQDPAQAPAAPRSTVAPGAGRPPPEPAAPLLADAPAAGVVAEPESPAAVGEEADADSAEPAPAVASGEPPPLYATRPPPAATLRYALHYYGRSGEAVLSWRPNGTAYRLQLQGLPMPLAEAQSPPRLPGRSGRGPPSRPLIEQASQGQLDANGLAPDRFTDSRRGRGQRAANFRRELGRIEFSGPAIAQTAWPGAQDRLSWWVQLPAILAAAAAVPAELRLFVVDARGRGELWRFDHLGTAAGLGRAALQHWRHEPAQAEGQRVELWLDPAQGHWPVLLRLTSLRTGQRFELQLLAIDPSTP